MRIATALLVLASLLVGGCAPATRVSSNKSSAYGGDPKRVFIVTDIGTDFGKAFYESFEQRFRGIMSDCGATMQVSRLSSLELDEDIHLKRMKAFGADALMMIRRNGGTRNQYGLFHVIYDARLVDVATNKTVWRANISFRRGGAFIPITKRGEALAVDVSNRLKQDGIFHSCAMIATEPDQEK